MYDTHHLLASKDAECKVRQFVGADFQLTISYPVSAQVHTTAITDIACDLHLWCRSHAMSARFDERSNLH